MSITEKKLSLKSILAVTVILPILVIAVSSIAIYITAKSVQPQATFDPSYFNNEVPEIAAQPETAEDALALTKDLLTAAVESNILKYNGSTTVSIDSLECENKSVEEILSFAGSSITSEFMSFYESSTIKYGEDASYILSLLPGSTPDGFTAEEEEDIFTCVLSYDKVFDNMYFIGDDTTSVNMFIIENSGVFSAINQKFVPEKCEYILTADKWTGEIISLSVKRVYDFSANIAFKNTLSDIGTTPLEMKLLFSEDYSFSYAGIKIEEDIMTLDKNGYNTLTVTPFVEEGLSEDEYSLEFSSSDTAVATVDENGQVSAVSESEKPAEITVTLKYLGKTFSDTCPVYVVKAVESVKISDTSLSLTVGSTHTLSSTVSPDKATIKEVIYVSSDEAVAMVDKASGKITAVSEGTATVTAVTAQGYFAAECTVTVTK